MRNQCTYFFSAPVPKMGSPCGVQGLTIDHRSLTPDEREMYIQFVVLACALLWHARLIHSLLLDDDDDDDDDDNDDDDDDDVFFSFDDVR